MPLVSASPQTKFVHGVLGLFSLFLLDACGSSTANHTTSPETVSISSKSHRNTQNNSNQNSSNQNTSHNQDSTNSGENTNGNPLARETVRAHAEVRASVGVQPLEWSDQLAGVAQDWATHLCAQSRGNRVVLQHRPNNNYGENLFWQGGSDQAPSVSEAVHNWLEEQQYYDQHSGTCRGGVCGHYTQMVWRESRQVGCAVASCGPSHFWVCNYDPPGNFVGRRPY